MNCQVIFILLLCITVIVFFGLFVMKNKENTKNEQKDTFAMTKAEQNYFKNIKKAFKPTLGGTTIPKNFRLGFSSAAYQIEGGQTEGGRGLSQWDDYLMGGNSRLSNTGQFAANFYYAYRDDFKRLKAMGVNTFRFSIAWSRVYPNGESSRDMVNPHGIDFYKQMISELIKAGIEPVVCLCHWDMPSQLINSLKNSESPSQFRGLAYQTDDDKNDAGVPLDKILMDSWKNYCTTVYELIIKPFRNHIYYVSSINELCTIANNAYSAGYMAPGLSPNRETNDYGDWNSSYWALYNLIRMHRVAYVLYKKVFKGKPGPGTGNPYFTADTSFIQNVAPNAINAQRKGESGPDQILSLNTNTPYWKRCRNWGIQMVWDPIIKGQWAPAVEDFFKTPGKNQSWRGKFPPTGKNAFDVDGLSGNGNTTTDIIAFHYYNSTVPIQPLDDPPTIGDKMNDALRTSGDPNTNLQEMINDNIWSIWDVDAGIDRGGVLMSNVLVPYGDVTGKDPAGPGWIGYYPEGMGQTADILHDLYPEYKLIQTESGIAEPVDQRITVQGSVNDIVRVDYYSRALDSLLDSKAHKDGMVLGCLFWAHIDNLEWMSGFVDTFGCYYCNYWGPGKYSIRNPKMSAGWMAATSKNRQVITTQQIWDKQSLFNPPIHKDLIPKLCNKRNTNGTLVSECNGINKPLNSIILTDALKTIGGVADPYHKLAPCTESITKECVDQKDVDQVDGTVLKQSCGGGKKAGSIRTQLRSCSSTGKAIDYILAAKGRHIFDEAKE